MRLAPLALLFFFAIQGSAQSILVLSKRDHTLAIVDPATLRVTAKVPVGNDPHEVIASADGTTAYVSNYGFGAFNTLAVVDLVHAKPLPQIDLGALRGPHGLAFAGGKVWFTAETAKAVGRYDPATHKLDLILGTGQDRTHMILIANGGVAPDSQTIITTNVTSGTVSVIDQELLRMSGPPPGGMPGTNPPGPAADGTSPGGPPPGGPPMPRTDWHETDWHETVVPVGHGAEGFDLSPDGQEIWVANAQDATVSIIGLREKLLLDTIHSETPGANRLKFTPDGTLVLVSAGPSLVVLDARSRREVKRIPIGHGSGGILVQPDGARAFVACGPDNNVVVIDLRSLAITGHIDAGGEPDGMAWAPRR
jgi:YVTN family beta-propeller protein